MFRVMIVGRLTRDAEVKSYQRKDGSFGYFTVFGLAANNYGEEEASFVSCNVSGELGNYLHMGDQVTVTGTMKLNRTDDGKTYANVKVDAGGLEFGQKKGGSNHGGYQTSESFNGGENY